MCFHAVQRTDGVHAQASCLSFFTQGLFFMTKSLYVGNLPWSATEDDVRDLFAPYGEVTSVKLVSDRETGRSPRFWFCGDG